MARVTLRLPDDLHRRLRQRSRETGRSLNETILAALRGGLDAPAPDCPEETPVERERRLVREALAGITVSWDPATLFPEIPPLPPDFDWEEFRRSLPVLDPPLSQTIIQEREESRY